MRLEYILILLNLFIGLQLQSSSIVSESKYFMLMDNYAEAITSTDCITSLYFQKEFNSDDQNLNVLLINKKDDVFSILIRQEYYLQDSLYIKLYEGTIIDTTCLYVYSSQYTSPLSLYSHPNSCKPQELCNVDINEPLYIKDVYGTWLKVQFQINQRRYEGWIPSNEYCSNPYSTCN